MRQWIEDYGLIGPSQSRRGGAGDEPARVLQARCDGAPRAMSQMRARAGPAPLAQNLEPEERAAAAAPRGRARRKLCSGGSGAHAMVCANDDDDGRYCEWF